tara:strand:- start:143 stop:433 length:291 start_codon:yes stop_codon:yes gene_type:complete
MKKCSVLLDTLINRKPIIVISITKSEIFFNKIKIKQMQENHKDYEICIQLALDNAKKRISLLNNLDKKCVLDEYREWILNGFSKNSVLLLREDPII